MPNKTLQNNKQKQRNIPAFLKKTYNMLENLENEQYVQWSPNGIGFIILNEQILTKKLLPKYFKHSNYSSFIRQLNMYDFHKIRKGNFDNYFHHDKFIKNNLTEISKIKRKPQKKKPKLFINMNKLRNNEQQQQYGTKRSLNRTQLTLNSLGTIKHKSQQFLSLYSCTKQNKQNMIKNEPIYDQQQYEYKYNKYNIIDQNKFSNIQFNCEQQEQQKDEYFIGNNSNLQDDLSSNQKMSINNQINNNYNQEDQKQQNYVVQFNFNANQNSNNNQYTIRNGYHFMNVYHNPHFAHYAGYML